MKQLSALALGLLLLDCSGSSEAERTQIPVQVGAPDLAAVTTDLGYQVELTAARTAIANIEFASSAETVADDPGVLSRIWDFIVPSAHAHPGHGDGGAVLGELPGNFIIDWFDSQQELGLATMFSGSYEGANFAFRVADDSDGLNSNDSLMGHSVAMTLEVSRDGSTWSVDITLDIEPGTRMEGAIFQSVVSDETTGPIEAQLSLTEPSTQETLFDGIDFAELAGAGNSTLSISPGSATHNQLVRRMSSHDFYFFSDTP